MDYAYDALGRLLSETRSGQAMSYQYDAAGDRTQITWPDASPNTLYVTYAYDMLNRVTQIGEDGATSGVGLLASYTYDDHGRRMAIARAGGAGAATTIGYDGNDRVSSLKQNFTGGPNDVTWSPTYSHNPSPQAVSIGSTNDAYAYHAGAFTRNYVANGLNQYATVAGNAWTYDGRGNLTANTSNSYTYDPENRLLTASGPTAVTLTYDPTGHLQTSASATTTTFLYAGDDLVGEYDGSGNILRRYVPGPGTDEPLVWYEGAGTSDRRWLHADTAGSVIGYSDATGASDAIYAYDPYGVPDSWATGASRYRYTGQVMIPEAHLYSYKSRMYDPQSGRFLQTDPVGYQSDINLYAYVGNDPINGSDPSGLAPGDPNGPNDPDQYTGGPDFDLTGATTVGPLDVPGHSDPGAVYFDNFNVTFYSIGLAQAVTIGGVTNLAEVTVTAQRRRVGRGAVGVQLMPSASPQSNISCSTKLPDGSTVGSHVAAITNNINGAANATQSTSTPYGPGPSPNLQSPISVASQVYSGTNFRKMYGGPGANYATLGDAGNFAHFAVAADIGVPLAVAEAAAGGYSILNHPPSDWVGPFGMDPSATRTVSGYGAGCH